MPRRIKPVTRLRGRRASVSGIGLINGDDTQIVSESANAVASQPVVSGTGGVSYYQSGSVTRFDFAAIPEVVFVDQCAETEELGTYVLDPSARTAPGDLWWQTGARLQKHSDHGGGDYYTSVPVDIETVSGSQPSGLTWDRTTARLIYNPSTGISTPVHDWTVRLRASVPGGVKYSEPFRIRVLRPKVVYGADAATAAAKWSGAVAVDPTLGGTWIGTGAANQVNTALAAGTDAAPAVLFITPGTYSDDRFLSSKNYLYILGDPSSRPYMVGGQLTGVVRGNAIYYKNLDSTDCRMPGYSWTTGENRFIVSKVFHYDWTNSQNSLGTVAYEGWEPITLELRGATDLKQIVVNCQFRRAGGVNLQHPMYLEGRPSSVVVNNCKFHGGRQNAQSKTTARFGSWLNSTFCPVVDTADPFAESMWAQAAVDAVACGRHTVYNCSFISLYQSSIQGGGGGFQNGPIYWRQRNALCGSDWPWPSYLSQFNYNGIHPTYQPTPLGLPLSPPLSGVLGSEYPDPEFSGKGWADGPETYEDPAFWSQVAAYSANDPNNPWSYKKYISYCDFTFITLGLATSSQRRYPWFSDDGTLPRIAYIGTTGTTTGGPFYDLSAPANWTERSATFAANNKFTGWVVSDLSTAWVALDKIASETPLYRIGPGPWPVDRNPPRSLTYLGGDVGPHPEASVGVDSSGNPLGPPEHVELPSWFRLSNSTTEFIQSPLSSVVSSTSVGGFSSALNTPSLNQRSGRINPTIYTNGVTTDFPSSSGGTTTNGVDGRPAADTRAWIWGSRFVWDPVNKKAMGIYAPHLYDGMGPVEAKGLNPYNALLGVYTEADNTFRVYEAPLNDNGPWSGFTSHMFDSNCLVGQTLYKPTQPYWDPNTATWWSPQVVGINVNATDFVNGAAVVSDIGRPIDGDGENITGCAMDYHQAQNKIVLLHKSRLWLYDFATGQWGNETQLGFTVDDAYHNMGHYNPTSGWFVGGGGCAVQNYGAGDVLRQNYQWIGINPQGQVIQLDNSPVCMSVFDGSGWPSINKCAGTYIPNSTESIFFHDNGNMYGLDPTRPSGSQWRTIGTIPTANRPVDWVCSIPEYNCILIGSYGGYTNYQMNNRMFVYRTG